MGAGRGGGTGGVHPLRYLTSAGSQATALLSPDEANCKWLKPRRGGVGLFWEEGVGVGGRVRLGPLPLCFPMCCSLKHYPTPPPPLPTLLAQAGADMHYRRPLFFFSLPSHFACVLCLAQHELARGGGGEGGGGRGRTPRSTVCVPMAAGESEMDCQPS